MTEVRWLDVFQWTTMAVLGPTLGVDEEAEGAALDKPCAHIDTGNLDRQIEDAGAFVNAEGSDTIVPLDTSGIGKERRAPS